MKSSFNKNFFLLNHIFNFRNRKKLHGVKSGEQGGEPIQSQIHVILLLQWWICGWCTGRVYFCRSVWGTFPSIGIDSGANPSNGANFPNGPKLLLLLFYAFPSSLSRLFLENLHKSVCHLHSLTKWSLPSSVLSLIIACCFNCCCDSLSNHALKSPFACVFGKQSTIAAPIIHIAFSMWFFMQDIVHSLCWNTYTVSAISHTFFQQSFITIPYVFSVTYSVSKISSIEYHWVSKLTSSSLCVQWCLHLFIHN